MPPVAEERPEFPAETRDLIVDYRTEQLSIRSDRSAEVAAYLEQNPEATAEELRAVIQDFNEQNADRLESQADLRQAIREDVREVLPDLPQEVQDKMVAYTAEAERLRTGRRETVSAFVEANPDATTEEIRTVVADYNRENAEDIVANTELRREIRSDVRDLRGSARPLDREAVSERRQQIRANVAGLARDLKDLRADLKDQLQADGADREAIIREFRQSRAEILRQAKEETRERVQAEREEGRN